MRIFLYCIYTLGWLLVLPFLCIMHIWEWYKKEISIRTERFVQYPRPDFSPNTPIVWFHGSSLGEVISLIPLMKELQKRWGSKHILTTNTSRGRKIAVEKKVADFICYAPWDISYIVDRFIHKLRPNMLIVFETEIWPNMFWKCEQYGIPVILVSGRISQKSYPRYRKMRFFFRHVLSSVYCIMQSQEDMERIIQMGALVDRTQVIGDIKLDGLKTNISPEDSQFFQQYFSNLPSPVIVVGSTHPGEEEMMADIYLHLQQQSLHFSCIIAPRHLDRLPSIMSMLDQKKISYVQRSQLIQTSTPHFIILDTYGELAKIYALADIAIMGGTFAPIGGHNLMEASALAKPVIFGPHIANCRHQAKLLLEKNAGIQVMSASELEQKIIYLLDNMILRQHMGKNAQDIIMHSRGALQKSVCEIIKIAAHHSQKFG